MERALKDGYDSDTFGTRGTSVSRKKNGARFARRVIKIFKKIYSVDGEFSFGGVHVDPSSI